VWRKLESGTDVDLLDIWGSPDGSIVWACGHENDINDNYLLRKRRNQNWEIAYDGTQSRHKIRDDSLSGVFAGVYTNNDRIVFIGTNVGIYKAQTNTKGEAKRIPFMSEWLGGYPYGLRGNGENDLFIVGTRYFIAHYNGITLHYYNNLYNIKGRFLSVSQRGSIMITVGYIYDPLNTRGIAFIGKR